MRGVGRNRIASVSMFDEDGGVGGTFEAFCLEAAT